MTENWFDASTTGVPGAKEKKSTAERSAALCSRVKSAGRSAVGGICSSICAICALGLRRGRLRLLEGLQLRLERELLVLRRGEVVLRLADLPHLRQDEDDDEEDRDHRDGTSGDERRAAVHG